MTGSNDTGFDLDSLRNLHQTNELARAFLQHAAGRKNNVSETSVDRAHDLLRQNGRVVSRAAVIALFKDFEDRGCGRFVKGRRGRPSRFEWRPGLLSVARAASGESEGIEQLPSQNLPPGSAEMLSHVFTLRPGVPVRFELPVDLTQNEARRLGEFINALPFERETKNGERQPHGH